MTVSAEDSPLTAPFPGIPDDAPLPFVLLDRVLEATQTRIVCRRTFSGCGSWQLTEAAAQACCLHQRWLCGFSRHAFLLAAGSFPASGGTVSGPWRITCTLQGQARGAAIYACVLAPEQNEAGTASVHGELTAGLVPYDGVFSAKALAARYRRIWTCLTS